MLLEPLLGDNLVSVASRVSREALLNLLLQASSSIEVLHRRKIVHGDIKPAHFLTTTSDCLDNNRPIVKLIDFGACTSTATDRGSQQVCFTPRYAAPELLQGTGRFLSSDLYSFGLVLLECLGYPTLDRELHPTHTGLALKAAEEAFPTSSLERALTSLAALMLAGDPHLRPPTAASVTRQLLQIADVHRLPVWNTTPWSDCLCTPVVATHHDALRTVDVLIHTSTRPTHSPRLLTLAGPPGSGKSTLLRDIAVHCFSMGLTGYLQVEPDLPSPEWDPQDPPDILFSDNSSNPSANRSGQNNFTPEHSPHLRVVVSGSLNPTNESGSSTEWRADRGEPLSVLLSTQTLSLSAMATSLTSTLGLASLPQEVLASAILLSGGNPRRTWELLRWGVDTGRLILDTSSIRFSAQTSHLLDEQTPLPPIATPIHILAGNARIVAALVSLAKAPLTLADLVLASCLAPHEVERCLNELILLGIVLPDHSHSTPAFAISGQLLALQALAGMSPTHTTDSHARLSHAFRSQGDSWDRLHAAAHHARMAGDLDGAVTLYRNAADMSISSGNHSQTIQSLEAASLLAGHDYRQAGSIVMALATAYVSRGLLIRAREVLSRIPHSTIQNPQMLCALLLKQAQVATLTGDHTSAASASRLALRLARTHAYPFETALARFHLGSSLIWLDRRAAGIPLLFRAMSRFRRLGRLDATEEPLRVLAATHWMAGRYGLALSYARRSLAMGTAYTGGRTLTTTRMNIGILLTDLGRYDAAARQFRVLCRDIPPTVSISDRASLMINYGEVFRARGQWRTLHFMNASARRSVLVTGEGQRNAIATVNQARALAFSGFLSAAVGAMREAFTRNRNTTGEYYRIMRLLTWGHLMVLCGSFSPASRIALLALEACESAHLSHTFLESSLLRALARTTLDRPELVIEALDAALTSYGSRSPQEIRLLGQVSLLAAKLIAGRDPHETAWHLNSLRKKLRRSGLAHHFSLAVFALAKHHLVTKRTPPSPGLVRDLRSLAARRDSRIQVWQAHYYLGMWREQRLQYRRATLHYRVAALTVGEMARELKGTRLERDFLAQSDVKDLLSRQQNLIAESGRRSRRNHMLLRRNEAVSRKMLASLSEIGQKLASVLELQPLLAQILDLAIENTGAERGVVFLRDEAAGEFAPESARGIGGLDLDDLSRFSRSVVKRASEGRTILTVDVGQDPALQQATSITVNEIKSILCIPMRARGRVTGVLYLDTQRRQRLFTEKDRAFVEAFANQAAVAIENARLFGSMRAENGRLRREVTGRFRELLGTSAAMGRLRELLSSVAGTDSTVLLTGESGTGKGVVARAVHLNGPRAGGAFVPVDCGALPEQLLEAELFGYRRGAFTGAERDRVGLIEAANGGTLFLDEIANTSLALQARLLRVLQEREVRRVGENEARKVDVRVIAATNAAMERLVADGKFREDLYYRLNVVRVEVPPLRERRDDIALLAEHFLEASGATPASSGAKRFGPGVLDALSGHDWPGNVRELENMVERLRVLTRGPIITLADLARVGGGWSMGDVGVPPEQAAGPDAPRGRVHAFPARRGKTGEQLMIEDALRRFGGDKAKAAKFIGWNRQKLYRRLKSYAIPAGYGKAA